MRNRTLKIENELGLHARAAARLVQLTSQFESQFKLSRRDSDQEIDGKSILGILLLAASQGTEIELCVYGPDEEEAVEAVVALFENRFGESR